MQLMWKIFINYFLKVGSAFGIFQFNFNNGSFIATKSKIKQFYAKCVSIVLIIALPFGAFEFNNLLSRSFLQKGTMMLGVVFMIQISSQTATNLVINCILIQRNSSKVNKLINTGIELIQQMSESFSASFFWLIFSKIIFFEWLTIILDIWANHSITDDKLSLIWMMLITYLSGFINIFVCNIFFCGIYCSGMIFKSLNNELKIIVKPLKTNQRLTHSQILQISDQIDQKMILHAKIREFLEDLNQMFSFICMMILIEAFLIITGELYSFYVLSRISTAESSIMSIVVALFQSLVIFSLVYASSHVTEQVERTGDILKVFVDSSVDDRLKNSVIIINFLLSCIIISKT